jgi:ferritin
MLSKPMLAKINSQITIEFFSSNLYLQMSSWAAFNNYPGVAAFLHAHAAEEYMHMEKFFDYVNETGSMAIIDAIEKPASEYENLLDMFTKILEHEKFVTSKIYELVDAAFAGKDFGTFNFLQWYVAEQREEETLFTALLDKIKMVGTEKRHLYFIDKEIGKLATVSAAAATPASQT